MKRAALFTVALSAMALSGVAMSGCVGAPESEEGVDTQQNASQAGDLAPNGRGYVTRDAHAQTGARRTSGISYHGGPVMTNGTNIYYIWYGNWSGNTATTILADFAKGLGGSGYWNINSTYYSGSTTHTYVQNKVALSGQSTVAYPYGTSLTDAQILQVVKDNLGTSAPDPNGIYFVLTSADVTASSGFCTQYCGWHNHATVNGVDTKYAFVGNPDRCISSCAAQSTSPNGNAGADGMASIIAHEAEEATTDPDLNAWYDGSGAENGDKCAWTFGTESTASNGSKYNVTLGSRQFLIQQNWNASTQSCMMSY